MTSYSTKSLLSNLFLAAVLFATAGAARVEAGSIILAGDANLGNFIDGSQGFPTNAENADFFANVLGTGTTVLIQSPANAAVLADESLNDFYNGLSGVTSSFLGGSVAGALSGVDLFMALAPAAAYSGSEISALSAFLASGGTVFFFGDGQVATPTQNANINAALVALGSSLALGAIGYDAAVHTTTNIAAHPLTSGVTSLSYALANSVSGGTPLFYGDSADDPALVSVEQVVAQVPEPGSLLLLGAGFAVAAGRFRRLALRRP